jgi:hypothetical protein
VTDAVLDDLTVNELNEFDTCNLAPIKVRSAVFVDVRFVLTLVIDKFVLARAELNTAKLTPPPPPPDEFAAYHFPRDEL